jgi:TIR domain
MKAWDFFLAHSHHDAAAAVGLYDLLVVRKALVFLDRKSLAPGSQWGRELKEALARSRVIVVLVSRHSDSSWYLEDEIAIAVNLVRSKASAYVIIPVLLRDGRLKDMPYGLSKLNVLREADGGLESVAKALLQRRNEIKPRPATQMLVHAVDVVDELWADAEPALTGRAPRTPDAYRMRFVTDGTDMVSRIGGNDQVRITRAQFKRKFTPEQLDYVETLERSMELNRALWRKTYPKRTTDVRSRTKAEAAMAAIAEDLEQVLDFVEHAGFWLDDHYVEIRSIAAAARKS